MRLGLAAAEAIERSQQLRSDSEHRPNNRNAETETCLSMKAVKYTNLLLIVTCTLSPASPVRAQGSAPASSHLNLMPVPASVRTQAGRLAITGSFSVAV